MRAPVRARWLALGIGIAWAAAAAPLLEARAANPPAAPRETPIPAAPARWVTDQVGFLSPGAAGALDERLGNYDRQTGHQLLVYIDRTTGGVPIEDWAVKAFERWRVGRKGIDDGLVLFVFSEDRRVRIEVGYGLEERVPDAVASRIINERIVPRIRAGDRDGAIVGGVDALIARIGGEGAGAGERPVPTIARWKLVAGGIVLFVLLLFAITHPGLAWLLLMNVGSGRGRGGGWGGGGFGGGGFGGGGFSGGGGRSGGGGASGSW